MRHLPLLLLALAGAALGWIALRAPEPHYAAPALEEDAPLPAVPLAIIGDVPAGYVVREFQVAGMCCQGCARKLHDALVALPGVQRAAVDVKSGKVSALAELAADPRTLSAALAFDKYRVVAAE